MTSIRDCLRGRNISGFEGYDLFSVLYLPSALSEIKKSQSIVRYFIKLLIGMFIQTYHYVLKRSTECDTLLFVVTHGSPRPNSYRTVQIASQYSSKGSFLYREKSSWYLRIDWKAYQLFPFLFKWVLQVATMPLSMRQRVILLIHFIDLFKFRRAISMVSPKDYNLLVVLYDAGPTYNYLVQWFKKEEVLTATLQHGIFLAPRCVKNNIEYQGVEFLNSNSDYFLAWNNFTRDEAIHAGMSSSKIRVLGIVNYPEYTVVKSSVKGVFGVVLNTMSSDSQNRQLITFANFLARYRGLKYKLKYHPIFKGNEYDSIIEAEYSMGTVERFMSVRDYVSEVDFTLISNSSVLMELVFWKHRTFRFSSGDEEDKYRSLPFGAFTTNEGLLQQYEESEVNPLNNELFDQLCTVVHVRESYVHFFRQFE